MKSGSPYRQRRRASTLWLVCTLLIVISYLNQSFASSYASSSSPHINYVQLSGRDAYIKAMEYARAGQTEKAVPYFERAVVTDPDFLPYQNDLGVAYLRTGRFPRAHAMFLRVIQKDPSHGDAASNIDDLARVWPSIPIDPITARITGRPVTTDSSPIPPFSPLFDVMDEYPAPSSRPTPPPPPPTPTPQIKQNPSAKGRVYLSNSGTGLRTNEDEGDKTEWGDDELLTHRPGTTMFGIDNEENPEGPRLVESLTRQEREARLKLKVKEIEEMDRVRQNQDRLAEQEDNVQREKRRKEREAAAEQAKEKVKPQPNEDWGYKKVEVLPGAPKSEMERRSRINTNIRQPFPRIHIKDWARAENAKYRKGLLPFILVGALDSLPLHHEALAYASREYVPDDIEERLAKVQRSPSDTSALAAARLRESIWSPKYLAATFPTKAADFYPHNMDKVQVHPFMADLRVAVNEFYNPTGDFPRNTIVPGSYIQFNVDDETWTRLTQNVELPSFFTRDLEWLNECFGSRMLVDEFTKRVHWRMVLMGSKGAGMFNHYDVLRTSSWQAQLTGAKRWHICAPDQRPFLYGAGKVDCFHPDYESFPLFRHARCYDDTVQAGEFIFYPRDYWHQTENLMTPSVAISGSHLDEYSWKEIRDELEAECSNKKYNWNFSAELCEALRTRCFVWWRNRYSDRRPLLSSCKPEDRPKDLPPSSSPAPKSSPTTSSDKPANPTPTTTQAAPIPPTPRTSPIPPTPEPLSMAGVDDDDSEDESSTALYRNRIRDEL